MPYELKLEQFSGPLEKLLSLIEERKLTITDLSLADVTADFLEFLRREEENLHPMVIADFVAVAAKLVLIKSKALLPDLALTEEEEGEIRDLESRLALYRLFAGREGTGEQSSAAVMIRRQWSETPLMAARPLFFHLSGAQVFYPPPGLKAADLAQSLSRLAALWKEWQVQTKTLEAAVVSVEEKIQELAARLEKAAAQSFNNIAQNRPRSEVIALFLAILHLLRDRTVRAGQAGPFGDIIINKL